MNRLASLLTAAGLLLVPLAGQAQERTALPEPPAGPVVTNAYGTSPKVVVPLVFPVLSPRVSWSDSFGAPRDGGRRRHHGQDLMAPKLTPLVAAFAGTVRFHRTDAPNVHNTLTLQGDTGWIALYMHINNDTPGTDDGLGSAEYAFAPGLQPGDRVEPGQLLGWVGDSGNAESTGPHLHFELWGPQGVVNAAPSLRAAETLREARLSLPGGALRPGPGETRLDGTLRLVDASRGLLCLQLIATQAHGKKPELATTPARRWVRLQGARLALADGSEAPVAAEALPKGTPLSALVHYLGPVRAAPATRLALHRPLAAEGQPLAGAAAEGPGALGPVDAALPYRRQPDEVRVLAGSTLPATGAGPVMLSGAWDDTFLYLTISAPEPFRTRLQVEGMALQVTEEGVRYDGGPGKEDVPGAAMLTARNAAGGSLQRVMLPLKLLPPRTGEGTARTGGRILRLRAVVELESGTRAQLPESGVGLTVRLEAAAPMASRRPMDAM